MVGKVSAMLQQMTWGTAQVGDFLGRYLTEPKPTVYFEQPRKISLDTFTKKLQKNALHLNLKSQLLFYKTSFYLNGEKLSVPHEITDEIMTFADTKTLNTAGLRANIHVVLGDVLYEAYLAGFMYFGD